MKGQRIGKEALLDAAAVLYDEDGIDAVSLNRINEVSGHRNRSAANYHFGTKDAITRALFLRGSKEADRLRSARFEELAAETDEPTLRQLIEVILAPQKAMLGTLDGRRHLRLHGQLASHPRYRPELHTVMQINPSLVRASLVLQHQVGHLPMPLRAERVALMVSFVVRAFADQAHLIDAADPVRRPFDADAFTANVIDLVEGMMRAPTTVPAAV